MEKIKLSEILSGLGSLDETICSMNVSGVTIDSRKIMQGDIFVAINGERVDGHDFVAQAIQDGALIAIVERFISDIPAEKQLVVDNSLNAMITMGKNYRCRYDTKMVAVTGSVGKTTTKEFLHSVISAFGKTLKNEGNKNNEIGLPETLFNLDESYEYGVLEMGMTAPGDIAKLTDAVNPVAAVISNIGVAHIEQLGSRENIRDAKLEVVEGIIKGGVLVVNHDNDMLKNITVREDVRLLTFGIEDSSSDIIAVDIKTDKYDTYFTILNSISKEQFQAEIPALGKHNVYNALSAYAVAYGMGLEGRKAVDALKGYRSSGMRQRIVPQDKFVVIEDCYNANPDSMRAAIETLAELPNVSYRIAVLGDMLELGDLCEDAHKEVGELLVKHGVDAVVTYGEHARIIAETAGKSIANVAFSDDRLVAMDYINDFYRDDCAVLFKASRGIKLEELMELFYRQRGY